MSKNPEIKECVTMAQFNEMKRSMEEKQEKLPQDLQEIVPQLRMHHNVHDTPNNQDDEVEETNEQLIAQVAREQRSRTAAHAGRSPILGHRNGGNGCGNGRGRSFGDRERTC
jgi:hypothetical protein